MELASIGGVEGYQVRADLEFRKCLPPPRKCVHSLNLEGWNHHVERLGCRKSENDCPCREFANVPAPIRTNAI